MENTANDANHFCFFHWCKWNSWNAYKKWQYNMSGIETEDINELLNTFHKRYQEGLETKMRGSSFTFQCIDLLEYNL